MKTKNKILLRLSALIAAVLIGIPLLGSAFGTAPSQVSAADQKAKGKMSELTVHYLDVGQGDCILAECDGEYMLIDAGDNDQGTKIQNYLTKQGVKKLKYAVGTHPDADHIGGLDVILYKFACGTVMMPDMTKDTVAYRDVADTMKQKKYKNTVPEPGDSFKLGSAVCTVLGPVESYEDANNNSIVLMVEHGENRFLFMGDAEEEEEADILKSGVDVEADVLKAGHHGSRFSSSKKFLEAVPPEYAVISCGENNSYGHPHAETLNNLRTMGVEVFRSDEQGTIVAVSDGSKITWNSAPSDTWKAGEPTGGSGSVSGSSKVQKNTDRAKNSGENAGNSSESTKNSADNRTNTSTDSDIGKSTTVPENTDGGSAETPSGQGGVQSGSGNGDQFPTGEAPASGNYIGNKNNGKLHRSTCSYLPLEKNQAVFQTREEAVAAGYDDPCKRCKP